MIDQLEQLCLAVGGVRQQDAKQVVATVNRCLRELLDAQMVKLFWRKEAEDGVMLEPIAYVNATQGRDPQTFYWQPGRPGVLEWVYGNGEPLWLDGLRHASDPSVNNRHTKREIPAEALRLPAAPRPWDALMVVPIVERGTVHGLYAVELADGDVLSERVLSLLQRLGDSLGKLLFNADTYSYDLHKTSLAIEAFTNSAGRYAFDPVLLEQNWRTAFVARPYRPEFTATQTAVESILQAHGVRAQHYKPDSKQYVVAEIIGQIKRSHFCVADLTSNNANVLAEVGMMMALGKTLLVLKQRRDDAELPFDLRQFNVWEYELGRAGDLLVFSAADNAMIPFDDVVEPFFRQIPRDTGFFDARRWQEPDRERRAA